MKAPAIRPIRNESRKLIEKVNDLLVSEPAGSDSRIIIMKESDLKKLIVDIIADMDYVRKQDLKRELELIFQGMIRSKIDPEGEKP